MVEGKESNVTFLEYVREKTRNGNMYDECFVSVSRVFRIVSTKSQRNLKLCYKSGITTTKDLEF